MTQIFGDFIENLPDSPEYLVIGFSPTSVPLKQRWRNNGLSADFLADYITTFFPGKESDTLLTNTKAEVKSAVSFIANELLENAMKFNDEGSQQSISIKLQLHTNKIIFLVSNSVRNQDIDKFKLFLKELTTSDPNELYIQKLEKNAEEDNNSQSGLGLLTMVNDYQAQLGWKFDEIQQPQVTIVTTMVQLPI